MRQNIIELAYIAAAILFIVGLKMLSSPGTARRGNLLSAFGMTIAILATLFTDDLSFRWIALGIIVGGAIGWVAAARVPMTSMPEFVALFNGFGGLASLLVGWAEYERWLPHWRGQPLGATASVDTAADTLRRWADAAGGSLRGLPLHHTDDAAGASPWFTAGAIYLAILIGGVTFTGSMVAYAKLAERISGKPYLFRGQQWLNAIIAILLLAGLGLLMWLPAAGYPILVPAILLSLALGVLLTIPIGGADMPVVISLLNSYSGLAACAAGFVILNTVLIVSGSLVGASGIILTTIMCKAMNRSLANVLFGGFGATAGGAGAAADGEVKALSASDAYYVLEAAGNVVVVPGYGMAVAQAQHAVRELGELLEKNGAEVRYAIHPVAGRMPGHMNVLLAEANVPYEQLVETDDINPAMEAVDVAIVIGANDVVNPAAREDASSPIYGMPVINVDKARTVFVLKRSMRSGFAGIENPLFYKDNVRMLFGDAKETVQSLIGEFKA